MKTNFSEKKTNKTAYGVSIGMVIGAGVGIALGAATNNMGLWLPICVGCGLALGASVGVTMDTMKKKKEK